MTLSLSTEEARRFLGHYHLATDSIDGVFGRLGSIQYDPLNPVGRNHDLVLQARVPGYRVDDWQTYAYTDRRAYDAWDKQACLVPASDWAMRTPIRERFHAWHDRSVLDEYPEAVKSALAEIDGRGPLSSLEFSDRTHMSDGHSWYGPTRIKRILRALWIRGELVTHHREAGRHYYDRPERVIPEQHLNAPAPSDEEYFAWVVMRRHRAAGLLRPRAEQAIWSVCGDRTTRQRAIADLVESGDLTAVHVGPKQTLYHLPTDALDSWAGTEARPLHRAEPASRFQAREPRMVFLGPLDSLLWDRRATREIFDFDYVWEVYKPECLRRWGYYVLPVLYGDRFVARFESRLDDGVWSIQRWWWEEHVRPDAEMLDALRKAAGGFARYLGATRTCVLDRKIDAASRAAIRCTNRGGTGYTALESAARRVPIQDTEVRP